MRRYREPSEEISLRERENLAARALFTVGFISLMVGWTFLDSGGKQVTFLDRGTCLLDRTFEATAGLNKFFLANLVARDWVIVFNSLWFDATICGFLFLFKAEKLPSISFAFAMLLSALTKTVI